MIKKITSEELIELKKSVGDLIIVDSLHKSMYKKQHIPGAISVPVDDIEQIMPKISTQSQHIVVYCYNKQCQSSPKAAEKLNSLGFMHLYDLEEGIEGWKAKGNRVVKYGDD